MPRLELDFTGSDQGGAYPLIPEGYYRLRLTKIVPGRAKSTGNRMLKTEWTIIAPKERGKKVPHNFTLVPQAMWGLRNMLLGLGAKVPANKGVYNTDQWLTRECGALIAQGELPAQNGRAKRRISQVQEWLTLADYEALRQPQQAQPSIQEAQDAFGDLEEDEDVYEEPDEVESPAQAELPF